MLAVSVAAGMVLLAPIATAAADPTSRPGSTSHGPTSQHDRLTPAVTHRDGKRQARSRSGSDRRTHRDSRQGKHEHRSRPTHRSPGGVTPADHTTPADRTRHTDHHATAPATTHRPVTAARSTVRTASAIEAELLSTRAAQPHAARDAGTVPVHARRATATPTHAVRKAPALEHGVTLLANQFEQAPMPGKLVIGLAVVLAAVMIFAGGSVGRRRSA